MDQSMTIQTSQHRTGMTTLVWILNQTAKRFIDIIVSAFGLLCLLPVFLLVAILIKRDSPGPVFFWCKRMGRHGRPFRMLKFRTMYERQSSYEGPPVTCDGDKRITPIGQWLRDTKVNELPQLWNVLIGEMSLVGPRPEDVNIARQWPEDAQAEILSVRPGITSPASILYHDEEHQLTQSNVMGEYFRDILPDKMRLDHLYVRSQAITTDFDVIFWTMAIFVPRIAKTKIPEGLLFFGPVSRLVHRYANWFLIDQAISLLVVGMISFLWRLQLPLSWGFKQLAVLSLISTLLFSTINVLTGLKKVLWPWATYTDGMKVVLSGSLVTLFVIVMNYFQSINHWLAVPALPIVLILLSGTATTIGFIVARYRLRLITSMASRWLTWRQKSSSLGEKVLIVGLGDGFNTAVWLLKRDEFRYVFSIVGVVDDISPSQLGMRVNECQVLGTTMDIPALVAKHDIGVIIVTDTEIDPETKGVISNLCKNCDLRIAFINQMTDILYQQISYSATMPDEILWSQDHIKYFALYDAVTGLPNRFLFREQLRSSLAYSHRYRTNVYVMLIVLDDLTKMCESLGQKARTELLKKISNQLLQNKRESDTLAYLDNNEFALLLENIPEEEVVTKIAQRVRRQISGPHLVDNRQFLIKPKILVSSHLGICSQSDGMRSEELEVMLKQVRSVYVSDT